MTTPSLVIDRKYRLLDLFCGAGGAAMGYHRAGFEVVGVDIKPQKHYPFEFHQGDAMTWPLDGYDVIHASPPCQAYSCTRTIWNNRVSHPDLVAATRERLRGSGLPWIIENVPGAPLSAHIVLCGTMFGLWTEGWELRRHRLFEVFGFFSLAPECKHGSKPTMGVYGGHARDRRRTLGVYGNGGTNREPRGAKATISQAKEIMGIDWMTTAEISQAIPPAYTEWIGKQLIKHLERR
jgi:DNA (cytosine-5)-methyltransferase 1